VAGIASGAIERNLPRAENQTLEETFPCFDLPCRYSGRRISKNGAKRAIAAGLLVHFGLIFHDKSEKYLIAALDSARIL
jgi:hypothetical protein